MSAGELVVVAMSGGVDSSVAAALLMQHEYRVVGMTMRVAPGGDGTAAARSCCSLDDVQDARRVCDLLGIPYYAIDMKEAFESRVVDTFVAEYLEGRTPNPCIACNTDMKFGALLDLARSIGAERVATGHYARVGRDPASGRWLLRTGLDPAKDQSYSLYGLTQEQLARALFPIGELTKAQVRETAERLGLPVAAKAESMDICFVPGGDYREVVAARAGDTVRPGRFVDRDGRPVGEHRGVAYYTVGQRRGLGLPGEDRTYVVELRPERDEVVVGTRDEASRARFTVGAVNWVGLGPLAARTRCRVRIRHRFEPARATVAPLPGGRLEVVLDEPALGVAPGQAAVFYAGDQVLFGGRIESPGEAAAAGPSEPAAAPDSFAV